MDNTETINTNMLHFKALVNRLEKTMIYVDHSVDVDGNYINGETYSIEFENILLLTCSEFENVAKCICRHAGIKLAKKPTIYQLKEKIIDKYPGVNDVIIETFNNTLTPLKYWGKNTCQTIDEENGKTVETRDSKEIEWWTDYNNIKHNRETNFCKANLNNCIYSMAALYVLLLFDCRIVDANMSLCALGDGAYFMCKYVPVIRATAPLRELPGFEKIIIS